MPGQLQGGRDDVIEAERCAGLSAAISESSELSHACCNAVRALLDGEETASSPLGVSLVQREGTEFGMAAEGHEGVVDLVGDARSEGAHGNHAIGEEQVGLVELRVGLVADRDDFIDARFMGQHLTKDREIPERTLSIEEWHRLIESGSVSSQDRECMVHRASFEVGGLAPERPGEAVADMHQAPVDDVRGPVESRTEKGPRPLCIGTGFLFPFLDEQLTMSDECNRDGETRKKNRRAANQDAPLPGRKAEGMGEQHEACGGLDDDDFAHAEAQCGDKYRNQQCGGGRRAVW